MTNPSSAPETLSSAKMNPVLLVFLIFPIIGLVLAVVIGTQHKSADTRTITPPPATYTQFSLLDNPAPDFTLQTPDGASVALTSLRGKWVFLNFWATWCLPCKSEMPAFQQLIDGQLGPNDKVTVLAINKDETAPEIKGYMDDLKLTIPVVMDPNSKVNIKYGIVGLPMTYVVDPNGIIRYQQIGPMTADTIKAVIDDLFKKYPA